MVHIKKLEIYGFKSFGFKNTVINFDNGLVAVTGPNGSGKSNVLDAIIFSIGENSPKALRVDRFQSLFHDTQNSSHKLVRVSITFENKDRGIPIDSDNVTITREMEGNIGESQYYLNGKKATKSAIMELLDVVIAIPNKLNIVQQGMITRISELNSEERRRIIEDIVGLSYFDEKKDDALKQLDEADRRLEIAFARMIEIRKRIDELEAERNDQLRFEHIDKELKKYKAIKTSNEIRRTRSLLDSKKINKKRDLEISSDLLNRIENIRKELDILESQKDEFLKKLDVINKTKAEISNKTSPIVYESERLKAMTKEMRQRIIVIEDKIPKINELIIKNQQDLEILLIEIKNIKIKSDEENKKREQIQKDLEEVNKVLEEITNKLKIINNYKNKKEIKYKKFLDLKAKFDLDLFRQEELLQRNNLQSIELTKKRTIIETRIKNLTKDIEYLDIINNEKKGIYENIKNQLELFIKNNESLEIELENAKEILVSSKNLSVRKAEQKRIVTNMLFEDITIANLISEFKNSQMIIGIVHELIHWDKNYERAILAAGSELMKAVVVKDLQTMLQVAEFIKKKNLPRIKMIPYDLIKKIKDRDQNLEPKNNNSILGKLSNYVKSNYNNLSEFLFGQILLTRDSFNAYRLSREGYKTVTINGELFEPDSKILTIDFGSQINDLTREIILIQSIEKLSELVKRLENKIDKNLDIYRTENQKINKLEIEKKEQEILIKKNEESKLKNNKDIVEMKTEIKEIDDILARIQIENTRLSNEITKIKRRQNIIDSTLNITTKILDKINKNNINHDLVQINVKKNFINKNLEEIDSILRQHLFELSSKENEYNLLKEKIKNLDLEKNNLIREHDEKINQIKENENRLEANEKFLIEYRNKEQELIDSSANSYSILQEFERKIKILLESERKLSKENNTIEKEIAILEKEIKDLANLELQLNNDLIWTTGHKDLSEETFDVTEIISELSEEYENVRNRLNLKANETYIQVIEGYRGMSERKNELEKERHSIVIFIDEIIKEKKDLFMNAFNKVNEDIHNTFSRIIGGTAWLEIEDNDNLFNSGIRLIVQFAGKPRRDSTSLSGGEKTMAATIFLLALQTIKPSPFYIMDEVDAHLDAQNTDRLSKILIDRSAKSQIIMVTLKDTTISKVSQIYGVYSKNGVSQIVKYKYGEKEPVEISINKR